MPDSAVCAIDQRTALRCAARLPTVHDSFTLQQTKPQETMQANDQEIPEDITQQKTEGPCTFVDRKVDDQHAIRPYRIR